MPSYNAVVFNRGTGLGNRLFPWGRCVIDSDRTGTPMLAPAWWWPVRKGALFAGGISRRAYLRQGLLVNVFQPRAGDVSGVKKQWILARAEVVPESAQSNSESALVVREFRDEANQFADLRDHRALLLGAFRAMTRQPWLKLADAHRDVPIGVNIRRGRDFKDAATNADFQTQGALRTPLSWFIGMLRAAREHAGTQVPAIVVSDGTADDLAPILAEPNVQLLRPGCPASDILVLSSCRMLIASGGSSFSAWAAFLGAVPVFTIPGQSLAWFGTQHGGSVVATCDPAAPGHEFLDVCKDLLARA